MKTKSQNTDVMVLGASHSLMVSNVPEVVIEAHSLSDNFFKGSENFQKDAKSSLERFGMWGGTLNVNQFMPNVTPEMLKPKDSDFIEPMFRMLSAAIVAKKYNPTEFPEQVLKESMPLLVGQSINLDHETDVANAVGSVKSVEWQDKYKDKETGIIIPAGINGIFKIDGLSNPRIARGIQMDPPSIHSNSVTVEFAWEPSHQFEDMWEFYSKLGTYTEDGELIRRIVTKIISYKETSLVWHGADPFAQKIVGSGKLNNPAYAGSQYYSLSEDKAKEANDPRKRVSMYDFKSLSEKELKYNTGKSNNENDPGNKNNHINQNTQKDMEELEKFMQSLFGEGLLNLSEGEKPNTEMILSQVKNLVKENQSLKEASGNKDTEIQTLKETNSNLQKEVEKYKESHEKWGGYISKFREETVASYKKLNGDNVDENILALLENEATSLETLKALRKTYETQLEDKFPMHCNSCGSKDISRSSSMNPGDDNYDDQKNSDKSTSDLAKEIAERKLRSK